VRPEMCKRRQNEYVMIYHYPTLRAESKNRIVGFTRGLTASYVLPDSSTKYCDSQNSVRPFGLLTGFSPDAGWITLATRVRKEAYAVRTR
jgi:hypothetical protein